MAGPAALHSRSTISSDSAAFFPSPSCRFLPMGTFQVRVCHLRPQAGDRYREHALAKRHGLFSYFRDEGKGTTLRYSGGSDTCTISLPLCDPSNNLLMATGEVSRPWTTSTRYLSWPALYHWVKLLTISFTLEE